MRRRRRRVHARPKCRRASAIKLIDFGSTTLEHQAIPRSCPRDTTARQKSSSVLMVISVRHVVDRVHINRTFDWRRALPNAREHGTLGDDAQRFWVTCTLDVIKRSSKEIIEKYFVPETYELRWPEKAKDLESERAVQAVQPLDIMIRTRFECEETGTLLRHLLSRLLSTTRTRASRQKMR